MKTATKPAAPDDPKTETISGVVSELKFQKASFCAGRIYSGGRSVSFSVKGFVEANKPATIRGAWENHPRWGRQFKGTEVVYTMPADADGIAAWLASAIDGMGPVKARSLVDAFGDDLPRVLQQSPEQVAVECKLPIEFVRRTAEAWHTASDRAALGTALYAYGLSQHEVEQLIARYKGGAVSILETDPYLILGDLPGFGWKRVDEIGRKVGVNPTHPGRVRAAVVTAVRKEYDEGSTCVGREGAMNAAGDLLGANVSKEGVEAGLKDALDKRLLVALGEVGLALASAARIERYLWSRFGTGADDHPCFRGWDDEDIESVVAAKATIQYRGGRATLDESQSGAVRLALTNRFAVVTGGAGAGKTLVAKAIYEAVQLGERPFDRTVGGDDDDPAPWGVGDDFGPAASGDQESPPVALCAPTGKAARRLSDVIGKDASTIHRLLQWNPETGRFLYGHDLHLPYDCVIVDEASMIDAALLESLFAAVGPDTGVVLIGDDNQLPPVGPGYPLRDILEHNLIPCHRLTKCHRQAGPLKHNSVAVLSGVVEPTALPTEGSGPDSPLPWIVHKLLDTPEKVAEAARRLFEEFLPKWGYGGLADHQFLTAKHEGQYGTKRLNEILQRLAQKRLGIILPERDPDDSLPLLVGDKVIQTRNNYSLNVMNGTIGVVTNDRPLVVEYDGRSVSYPAEDKYDVQLAYCLSVHKMQGSEVPCCVVVCPKAHAFMQHRNWLYTGLTRAQKTAVLMGDSDGIRRAAEKVETSRRRTVLELLAKVPEARPE